MEAVVAGDTRSFDELVRRHEDRIFGLCLRMTADRSDALEAAQETFIAAFRRCGTFRGDSTFSTWLYRIGINQCRDLLRRRRPVSGDAVIDRADPTIDVERAVTLRADLADALSRLPEDYRVAVVMHDVGGVPYDEIARMTHAKLGTVKSRISRGRRMLADALEPTHPSDASKERR